MVSANQAVQTSFVTDTPKGFKGELADNGFHERLSRTIIANHSAEYGNYVAAFGTDGLQFRRPFSTDGVLTFAGNVTAGDVITGIVSAQGNDDSVAPVLTNISVPFDTSQAVTAGNLATALGAAAGVTSSSVRAASSDLIVDIEMDAETHLTLTNFAVAGGSAPALDDSYLSSDDIIGILFRGVKQGRFDADCNYIVRSEGQITSNIGTQARINSSSEDIVNTAKNVAIKIQGDVSTQGSIRAYDTTVPSDSIAAVGAKFRSSAAADGIFVIGINLPQ